MEYITDAMEMVDHLLQPAFCVRDGVVVKVNPAGTARLIEPGTEITRLLSTGREEYNEIEPGCLLFLTLNISGQVCSACVSRKKDFDLFTLDQANGRSELQAMALAARELREPLAGVMITADQLFSLAQLEDPTAREQAARLNRGLYQMLRIISNMSDAGRYSADSGNRQEIRDITAIISEVMTKAQALADQGDVRLVWSGLTEPVYTLTDEEKLERAIFNMLSNALKFSSPGDTVQAALTRRGNRLYFSVSDSGCGISNQLRGGIFSRYCREPGVEDGRFGIGLGLVLIHGAATLHGGTVLIDHPKETGTRITISLAVRTGSGTRLRSPLLKVDYAGERDHGLLEFADILPAALYDPQK